MSQPQLDSGVEEYEVSLAQGQNQEKKPALYARLLWDLSILCKHSSHLMTAILSLLRNHYGFPNNVH